jgi:GNAT superfamily N-acetyltransferase
MVGLENQESALLLANAVELRRITVDEARLVRDAVLRQGLEPGGSVYPHDDEVDTLHLGAFVNQILAGVATVCREEIPDQPEEGSWRVRGMATLMPFRGQGLGKRLAVACIAHVIRNRGTLVWCTARATSATFYNALGFSEQGQVFRLPEYSDAEYVVMRRSLGPVGILRPR